MHIEWARLRTFSNFQFTMDVSIIQLARAGFFLSDNDCVTCYSCNITRTSWDDKEDPDIYHRKVSPTCNSVEGPCSRNIPITRDSDVTVAPEVNHVPEADRSENVSETSNRYDIFTDNQPNCARPHHEKDGHQLRGPGYKPCGANHAVSSPDDTTRDPHDVTRVEDTSAETNHTASQADSIPMGVNHNAPQFRNESDIPSSIASPVSDPFCVSFTKPKYPAYAVLSVREASYDAWPKHLTQTRKKMAEAGFVYTGHSDYTRCFFCGGGLRNWEPWDDPWGEHARWFPRCVYLLQNKGNDFVRSIKQSCSSSCEKNTSEASSDTESELATDIWRHAAVQSLLNMGYKKAVVESAVCSLINHKIISTGLRDIEAADILDEVFRIEETEDRSHMSDPRSIQRTSDTHPDTSSNSEDTEIQRLMFENQKLKEISTCKVCCEVEVAVVFLPCGHFVCCSQCAPAMVKCPACKVTIRGSIKTFLV
ncbi:baculoviral IAP repeat-containing protein 7-like [Ylistrum balloti]|uniref:baculoviral IAP repeat-containing protein 7-like n=1 Tax=Ylistrum balloti TaxID=509963 RepID=UPI002905C1F7|nr:baculoviral IAP repeat-containing protein 7-like [Ylistrum balloti]